MNDETSAGLSALFDFSFTKFITTNFLKVIYILGIAVICLGALGFLIAMIASGQIVAILLGLVIIPIIALLYIIFLRVSLEVIVVIFRMGSDLKAIAAHQGAITPQTGGFPVMTAEPASPASPM